MNPTKTKTPNNLGSLSQRAEIIFCPKKDPKTSVLGTIGNTGVHS